MRLRLEPKVIGGGLPKANPAIGALFSFFGNAGHTGGTGRAVRFRFV